jgi:hypothetical protein
MSRSHTHTHTHEARWNHYIRHQVCCLRTESIGCEGILNRKKHSSNSGKLKKLALEQISSFAVKFGPFITVRYDIINSSITSDLRSCGAICSLYKLACETRPIFYLYI